MTRNVLAWIIAVALLCTMASPVLADALATPEVTRLLELSDAAEEAGDRDLQGQYIHQAIALAEATGDAEGLADGWRFLSFLHMAAGDMQGAIDGQQKSLQISERAGNQSGISLALVNLGLILSEVGMFAQAVDHLRRAIALQEQMGFNEDLRAALNNLAIVEEALGNDEEAERLYSRVYQLAIADDDIVDQMYYYINMVDMLVKREQYELAEANLRRALELNDDEQTSELA